MGKYMKAGKEAMRDGELEYSQNEELAMLSLKVLDTIAENREKLPVKYTLIVLDDAKSILLQLIGV